ncbi:MAG: type II secretion system major pseudopilin GspG [Succinivibrionaceae bacterium]
MRNNFGFTLLEIMVVIVILGLLGGAVAPALMSNLDTANISRVQQDLNTFDTGLKAFKMQAGTHKYPTTEQGLKALVEKPTSAPIPKTYPSEGFIEKLSKDPWGNDYLYKYPSEHGMKYDIYSAGPDGESNTCDDIGNWNIDNVTLESLENCAN